MAQAERPRIGVGVLIFKDGKILLGKRKNAHGAGEYASPGGHLEFGETLEECAQREAAEETGLEIEHIKVVALANFLVQNQKERRQYLHVGTIADWKSGTPENREPEKCEGWDWYDPNELPQPSMEVTLLPLVALKTGQFYFGTIGT